ncbi:TetR/AcrR family transcriptional regulator [Sphingobium sp. 15-1]|uniref:TetR/AcrR family transcriptional regulator n=1 Tax=Sphingobium sp. 15-1 TaxID=2729616 RepID=UPI00159C3E8F|nr:TetR/AcrR family transcriptional regulator [Sphingobium sp. 15-1]
MKVSREQMAHNRSRILTEAGRLFREKGFDAVSVAEVMKASGLTHGGFYGHFQSKDDLIAHTITHSLGNQSAPDGIAAWMDTYLSLPHRDHPGLGCPTAALAGLMRQQSPEARASMGQVLATQIDSFANVMPGKDADQRRLSAIGNWSAMVGALILARSIDDPVLSEELLTKTRAWIDGKNASSQETSADGKHMA